MIDGTDAIHIPPVRTDWPAVMTAEEAIAYLRLDLESTDPMGTLRYWRERGLLRGVKISRSIRYTRRALDEFLERLEERETRE
jgi:hypothetical protein